MENEPGNPNVEKLYSTPRVPRETVRINLPPIPTAPLSGAKDSPEPTSSAPQVEEAPKLEEQPSPSAPASPRKEAPQQLETEFSERGQRGFLRTVGAAGLTLAALFGAGYLGYKLFRSTPQYNTGWNIKENSLSEVRSDKGRFSLEVIARNGGQYYVSSAVEPRTNELSDFILYSTEKTSLVRNDEEKTLEPQASIVYVPTLVANEQGQPKHKASLTEFGPEGVRTKRQAFSLGSGGAIYGITNYTQKDIEFKVNTMSIAGQEFYAPLAEKNTFPQKADFYLIPVKGTKTEVTPNGTIVLHSSSGIYELIATPTEKYFGRTNVVVNMPNVEDNGPRVRAILE